MTFQEKKKYIAGVIREECRAVGLDVKQIVLFGSQSRRDAGPGSDWDFLVCVKDELSFPDKSFISTKIQTRLAEKLIDADIIIKSEARMAQERDNVGVITYYAMKDGVPL